MVVQTDAIDTCWIVIQDNDSEVGFSTSRDSSALAVAAPRGLAPLHDVNDGDVTFPSVGARLARTSGLPSHRCEYWSAVRWIFRYSQGEVIT